MDLVRVTLERQFFAEADRVLSLPYGHEDAIIPAEMDQGDYINDLTQRAPKVIPGKPITYELGWSDEESRTVAMPEAVAKHYFGNWDIPEHGLQGTRSNYEMTRGYEKTRLALLWGGYKTLSRREAGLDAVPNGYRNLPKIAPPNIPHVVVHRLDSALRLVPNFAWRPWDVFDWNADVVPLTTEGIRDATPGLITVSEADLSRMIAEAVAEQMKQTNMSAAHAQRRREG